MTQVIVIFFAAGLALALLVAFLLGAALAFVVAFVLALVVADLLGAALAFVVAFLLGAIVEQVTTDFVPFFAGGAVTHLTLGFVAVDPFG